MNIFLHVGMRVFLYMLHSTVKVQWQKKVLGQEFLDKSADISTVLVFPCKQKSIICILTVSV